MACADIAYSGFTRILQLRYIFWSRDSSLSTRQFILLDFNMQILKLAIVLDEKNTVIETFTML